MPQTRSFNTVDGKYVNDNLPKLAKQVDKESLKKPWIGEKRSWGFDTDGINIETKDRLPSDAWQLYQSIQNDKTINELTKKSLYSSILEVYPELELWSATLAHGGAAPWEGEKFIDAIRESKAKGEVVMVQFHSGMQFNNVPSARLKSFSKKAINAGADIVVAHYPHVVGGIEYYKGKPIVYSLGNFVFDQNFMSTKSSGILRTIWEGDNIISSALVPIFIQEYKPTFVRHAAAKQISDNIIKYSYQTHNGNITQNAQQDIVYNHITPSKYSTVPEFRYQSGVLNFYQNQKNIIQALRADKSDQLVSSKKNLLPFNPFLNFSTSDTYKDMIPEIDITTESDFVVTSDGRLQVNVNAFEHNVMEIKTSSLIPFSPYKDSDYSIKIGYELQGGPRIMKVEAIVYGLTSDSKLAQKYILQGKVSDIQELTKDKTEAVFNLTDIQNYSGDYIKLKLTLQGVTESASIVTFTDMEFIQTVNPKSMKKHDYMLNPPNS